MIKKLLGTLMLSLTCTVAVAAGGGYPIEKAPNRMNDMASLQNGAKLFVNYCMGCHSANSMRYNKLTAIGLTEEQIKRNLLFTGEKVGDLMSIAMKPADAKKWFGVAPPDLSVIARARSVNLGPSGVDYVYTFLRSYYRDSSKVTGWNNMIFPNVGMPNVLWQLQGPREMELTTVTDSLDNQGKQQWTRTVTHYDNAGFYTVKSDIVNDHKGAATVNAVFKSPDAERTAAYDSQVADIANFLGWMAEPNQFERRKLGVWVLLFLGLFFVVAWRLNAAYWKDVR